MVLQDRVKTIKRLHSMMAALNIMHMKPDILAGFNATSTTQLTDDQLNNLCVAFQKQLNSRNIKPTKEVDPEIRKWRSVNLDLLTRMGIYKDSNSWTRVNEYLSDTRIAGKTLNKLNLKELKALSEKLRVIDHKRQTRIQAENRKALLN